MTTAMQCNAWGRNEKTESFTASSFYELQDKIKAQSSGAWGAPPSISRRWICSRRTIILRDSETCETPTAFTISSLSADLSRFHPDTVVYFAILYKQGRDQFSAGSINNVWLFQLLQRSGWDVDWFETDVDLKVHGFSIVVNDSTVLPPAGLKLAQILARHSIMIKWRQSPAVVSWTNDWCIYVGC